MRKKLMALMILSIIGTIGFILWVAGAANATSHWVSYGYWYGSGGHYESSSWSDLWYALAGCLIFVGCAISQFIIGIIVLSTKSKHGDHSGITTAAGTIGILGGVIFVGAIVSGIAAAQASKNSSSSFSSPIQSAGSAPEENDEISKMRRELEELKKANAEKSE